MRIHQLKLIFNTRPYFLFIEATVFTLLFFLFEGYQFGVGNQLVFLPVIESLFKLPHLAADFGVSLCAFYHPFFNISMAWLSNFVPLAPLFFLTQICLILLLYVTTRQLTFFFFDSTRVYWSAVLLMFLWAQQGIDDNVLWTNRLEAQYLAWPCILSAFSAYLSDKWVKAGLFTGLAILLHFQLGVITGAVLSVLSILPITTKQKLRALKFWIGCAVLGLPVFCYSFKSIFAEHFLIGPDFIRAASLRMSHHMMFDFRLAVLFIFLAFIPFGILKIEKLRQAFTPTQIRAIHKLIWLQSILLLFGVAQYADYYLGIGVLSRLQFLRLFPFIYATGVIFLAHILLQMLMAPSYSLRVITSLLVFLIGPRLITYQPLRENGIYVIVTVLTIFVAFIIPKKAVTKYFYLWLVLSIPLIWCIKTLNLSPQAGFSFHAAPFLWDNAHQIKNPWVDVCKKAQQIIPKSDLVISPPYMTGFVYFSKRKTFVEFKTMGSHRKTYTEWLQRLTLVAGEKQLMGCHGTSCSEKLRQGYNQLEPGQIDKVAGLYHAKYFITQSDKPYPYEKQYDNGTFKLYNLNQPRLKKNSTP